MEARGGASVAAHGCHVHDAPSASLHSHTAFWATNACALSECLMQPMKAAQLAAIMAAISDGTPCHALELAAPPPHWHIHIAH